MTSPLTHTSMQTARACLRRYYYRYMLNLARDREAQALRLGAAVHVGLAAWSEYDPDYLARAISGYADVPEWADPFAWEIEAETVYCLLRGYVQFYGENDPLDYVEVEQPFAMPLINPETNAESRTFHLAGKRDGIVEWGGRTLVLERKTCGEDIGPDSEYWLRLRIDPQIALYALAARHDGHNVSGVLYDVIRKPTIRPCQIPELDADGLKVVVDETTGERALNKNGSPRQSAGPGLKLVSRTETAEEFGTRLAADITTRPEHYYARREVPLLEDHLTEFRYDAWQQGQMLLHCRNRGAWFRNVSRMTCGYCEFRDLCLQSVAVEPDHVPAGYVRLDDAHPELLEDLES